jgi:hypothetical protein
MLLASKSKVLQTKYTKIYYQQDSALKDFIWRISGRRIALAVDFGVVKNAIDGITERVQSILDMYPNNFFVEIHLYPEYSDGLIAYYDIGTKAISVYADKVTDGVLAHEIAHAVINLYFDTPPPKKIQEILTQYVDKHLWSDY